ncbi:hypothetical protein ACIBSR_22250 [Streptomyces sp. NPDC049936]|uniref:hypothetical protein n=1 Tax=Streptomyces sp. NPDC049936 TaxID=3365599 RepID=UPI0037AE6B95
MDNTSPQVVSPGSTLSDARDMTSSEAVQLSAPERGRTTMINETRTTPVRRHVNFSHESEAVAKLSGVITVNREELEA